MRLFISHRVYCILPVIFATQFLFLRKGILFVVTALLFHAALLAQAPADTVKAIQDSLVIADTAHVADTIPAIVAEPEICKKPLFDTGWVLPHELYNNPTAIQWEIMAHHPYYHYTPVADAKASGPLMYYTGVQRKQENKDLLFYSLLFLFIVFALLKRAFPKYFNDLFRLFFRTTLKERQISEQLMQTPVPSVLLNVFFTLSTAFYICFVVDYAGKNPAGEFWLLYLYCAGGLAAAYFVKFIGLKISGWIFAMKQASTSYTFVVFIINKMIGILLLPFLPVLAFSTGDVFTVGMTLSWCLLGGMILYRLYLTYSVIRNQVRVSPFHFFLYFIAFEIAPLLLVYKALLVFFSETT